jgi:Carboxypeptidase regulatory-like domain
MVRRRIGQAGVLILACGALGACALLEPRGGAPPAGGAYEGDPSIRGVTVIGRVNFVGPIPRPDPIPVYRDSDFCGEEMPNETLLVEEGSHTVEGVVVSLEGVTKGKPLPQDQTRVVESRGCRFIPRVTATVVGSLLAIQSVDPIMHNTHLRLNSRFGDTVLNVVQVAGARGIQRRLLTAGLHDVRCDIHPFMRAFIHVFEHPYFSVTDAAGRYELTQVPPGTYRLKMWHEKLGTRERTVTVPEQGPATLDLEVDLRPTVPQRLAPHY